MIQAVRTLTTALAACLLLGCASTKSFVKNPSRLREVRKVAVLPFVCSSPDTGVAISEALSAQLVQSPFTVLERSQFERLLAEQKITLTGLLEEDPAVLGRLKGVDAVILGSATVDRGFAGLVHGGYKDYISMATARLVDVASGEVLVAANYSASGARTTSGVASPGEVGARLAKGLGAF